MGKGDVAFLFEDDGFGKGKLASAAFDLGDGFAGQAESGGESLLVEAKEAAAVGQVEADLAVAVGVAVHSVSITPQSGGVKVFLRGDLVR